MFPVAAVSYPSGLNPQMNGKLTDSQLTTVGLPGVRTARVLKRVGPALQLMVVDAERAGVVLTITSNGDSYRSLQAQTDLFLRRYKEGIGPGGLIPPLGCQLKSKSYQGKRWWLLRNMATAATPGTSNHGLGLALDFAVWNGRSVVGLDAPALNWLLSHAVEYGFSWELQDENWHLRYFVGDATPIALQGHEQGPVGPQWEDYDVIRFVQQRGKNAVFESVGMAVRIWMPTPEALERKRQQLIFNGVPAEQLKTHIVDDRTALQDWGVVLGADPGDV